MDPPEAAMTAQTPDLAGREVEFRLDRGFRTPLIRRGVVALAAAARAAAAGTALGTPMFLLAGLCCLFAAGCGVAYAWRGRFRTVLKPEGIQVRGYLNHFLPWSEIAGFTVGGHGAAPSALPGDARPEEHIAVVRTSWKGMSAPAANRRPPRLLITVRVVRTKGRRLTLRAPIVTGWQGDVEFYDKLGLMEQWRRLYGPPPGAAPR
jgi:hypothetical protein